jgi:HEAT repeat protein
MTGFYFSLGYLFMSFFSRLFGNASPDEKAIAKQVTKAKEPYAQPEYRRMAMEKLLEWDTMASLRGVLERFASVVQSPHWDEEEKRWLVDELVKKGDKAVEPLRQFLFSSNAVSHAILALEKLVSPSEATETIVQALRMHPPIDHRSIQAKMELIAGLEFRDVQALADLLVPYLKDHNDDVRCIALDVLGDKKCTPSYPAMLALLSDQTNSARVLRHAAMWVCRLGIEIDSSRPLMPEVLEDYIVKNGKLVSRRDAAETF